MTLLFNILFLRDALAFHIRLLFKRFVRFSEHHFEPELRKLISSLISLVVDNTTLMAADMCQYREICLGQAFCPLSLLILTIIATCFKHLATFGMLLLYSRSSSWKRISSLTPYSFICFMSVLICIKYWLALKYSQSIHIIYPPFSQIVRATKPFGEIIFHRVE